MKYENIFFDLYGTLVDIRTDETMPFLWRVMTDYYKRNGACYTTEELQKSFYRSVNEQLSGHNSDYEVDIFDTFKALYDLKGVTSDTEVVYQTAKEFRNLSTIKIDLYNGVLKGLKKLKKTGKKIFLLSNAQACFTMPEIESLGIGRYFEDIFLSSDYGVKKPSFNFFSIPFDKYGLDKNKSIMVGNDGTSDILGATNFGIDSLYVKTEISPEEPLPAATYVLSKYDFTKILKILTL